MKTRTYLGHCAQLGLRALIVGGGFVGRTPAGAPFAGEGAAGGGRRIRHNYKGSVFLEPTPSQPEKVETKNSFLPPKLAHHMC